MDARAGGQGCRVENQRRRAMARRMALVAVLLAGSGCRSPCLDTDRLVPRDWKGNPWGPAANSARGKGEIPLVPSNPEMATWDSWGRRNLRDGDVIFRMGDARAACGLFPFSQVSAAIANSRYSHSGIIAIENGEPVVYDTTTLGPQREPLRIWVLAANKSVAIKRPRPEYQACASGAVAFCRSVYSAQVPFDYGMRLGDDKFYCIEMTERAYQSAGLPLSKPVPLHSLPRYDEFPWIVRIMKLATKMEPNQLAYVIGNDSLGIWASPSLEPVYETLDGRPPAAPVRRNGADERADPPVVGDARIGPPPRT